MPLTNAKWTSAVDPYENGRPVLRASTGTARSGDYVVFTINSGLGGYNPGHGKPSGFLPTLPVTDDYVRPSLTRWFLTGTTKLESNGYYADAQGYDRLRDMSTEWAYTGEGDKWVSGYADTLRIYDEYSIFGTTLIGGLSVPYTWDRVDVAETIWALTRFYSHSGIMIPTRYLDQTSFVAYSNYVENLLYRSELFVWREVDVSIGELIGELVNETGALLGFGGYREADGGTQGSTQYFDCTLNHWENLTEVTEVIDATDHVTNYVIQRPSVRQAVDKYRINTFKNTWGSYLTWNSSASPILSSWSSPVRSPRNDNTLTYTDKADQNTYGVYSRNFTKRHCIDEISADAAVHPWLWTGYAFREVELSMGLRAFDFDVSNVIHISDPLQGIDGTEDLIVTKKVIDWDTLTTTVTALEIDRELDTFLCNAPAISGVLIQWLQEDGIVESGDISDWIDKSGYGYDAGTLARGGAAKPAAGTYNGETICVFEGGQDGLDLSNGVGITADGPDITVVAVVNPDADTAGQCNLLDATIGGNEFIIGYNYTIAPDVDYYYYLNFLGIEYHSYNRPVDTGWQVWTIRIDNKEGRPYATFHVNEEEVISTPPLLEMDWQNDIALGCKSDGTDDSFYGSLAEWAVYNKALLPTEIRRLVRGLKSKWAIT